MGTVLWKAMGAGASVDAAAAVQKAPLDELQAALAGLSPDELNKLVRALGGTSDSTPKITAVGSLVSALDPCVAWDASHWPPKTDVDGFDWSAPSNEMYRSGDLDFASVFAP